MQSNLSGVLRPPFQITQCLLVGAGADQEYWASILEREGVKVLALLSGVGALRFGDTSHRARRLEDLVGKVSAATPVLLTKRDWSKVKDALADLGFTTLVFIEDLFLPRATWNQEFADTVGSLADDIGFWLTERLNQDRGQSRRAGLDAIEAARAKEIACNGFGVADLSMLHPFVLILAEALLRCRPGPVIEVGSYVGGLTCSLAMAAKILDVPYVVFERGGAHEIHPVLPSSDILADLRVNLSCFGVADHVHLVPETAEQNAGALAVLAGQGARLLIIDADGDVWRKLRALAPYLTPGCFLLVDDFVMAGRARDSKAQSTRAQLYHLIVEGLVKEGDVIGWGTWFGLIPDPQAVASFLAQQMAEQV